MSGYIKEKYINPFTDYGFKRLFGEDPSKDLLLDFLNELLHSEQGHIKELTYLKSDKLGSSQEDRKAIFDLYCVNERGEKFIVELQKTKQKFFKDRTVYYSTFPIREAAQPGSDWNFELNAIYTVAILDFVFDEDKDQKNKYLYNIKLSDIETNKIFYDKLTFVYLEMPKFKKTIKELETRFDKWLYIIRNLNKLDRIPDELREGIFERLFEVAEIARFTPEEVRTYEDSVKAYRDLKNSMDTAREEGEKIGEAKGLIKGLVKGKKEGKKEGRKEEKIEVAKKLKKRGYDILEIVEITGLTREEIEEI
jgi:predicted transposase/invertase (TIGR01784 family)